MFKSLPAVTAVATCGREARPAITVRRDVAEAAVWIAEAELVACGRSGGAVRLLVEPRTTTRGRAAVERWLVSGFELVEPTN
jgi:hypothetical protein